MNSKKVNDETQATLIRARGFSRLSPWFAFGHAFSQVSGYTIEVNQNDHLWRTDENASPHFKLISENVKGESIGSNTGTVAVGVSVTGSIEADVREYIAKVRGVDALLFLRPENELGVNCLQSGGDVVALCQQFKTLTREFVRDRKATKLLLFYFGPLSGSCFIGHQLNAICKEVQIMEKLSGEGYMESFILS
ncbi:SAVED domain-containing protein [Paraflavitalea speifideaquila]|uniref:SAVED domain-containing protein n=1 Tax=Paraflavitalea speifideaquila TaxID=3076558 RepID=UPI0028EDF537|nr:SAVED domain-containing protein [Paraflavitalea speifideiaquila]